MTFQLSPTSISDVLCVCVCVMCLCNICIDVKRLTQGAQVWLSFLCQRRPPDVIAISRGDVPLTYLQCFLHLFSDRRGTGPSQEPLDRSLHHFHGLLAAWFPQITSVIIFYSFLVIETHVDMLIDVSSGHLGGWEIKHESSHHSLLTIRIVTCNCFHSPHSLGWRKRMIQFTRKKKLPIDFLYNFYEFPLACVLPDEFPIIIHIFHKLPTYFYAPTNLLRTQGCEMLTQSSTNATATTGHHTNLPCHRRHWGRRHRAGKMVVTQILCVSDWRSHMKSKGESTHVLHHVLVKITDYFGLLTSG